MSEQTELKVYKRHIQTSVDGEVYEGIVKGMKETGAESRAEYVRDILTLWHKYPNEGRQGLIQGIENLKKVRDTTMNQRDDHLQACKSHITEFLSIQELLGISGGMACPERIVAKIQELMDDAEEAGDENNLLKNTISDLEADIKSRKSGMAQLDKEIGKLMKERDDAAKQLLEQVEKYDRFGKTHEQVVKEATEQIDELSEYRKGETGRADASEKERDVQTSLYIEGMNSICNALGYTEWVFATEEGGLVNRINESIRKLNDEGKKLNTELASCRDSRYQTNEKLIKSEYLKNERERELDFYMNREPLYKIARRRLVQFFTKKEK